MPSLNGIELGNVLGRFAAPPAIVFVTAYEEYAVRAFDIGACDYLLKPVSRARLGTALVTGRWPRQRTPDDDPRGDSRGDSRAHQVGAPEQVRWVEAEGDYVRLHMTDGSATCCACRSPIWRSGGRHTGSSASTAATWCRSATSPNSRWPETTTASRCPASGFR